jgi:hypothetical protein
MGGTKESEGCQTPAHFKGLVGGRGKRAIANLRP